VNPVFIAIEADSAFIVIPLNNTGRIDFQRCKVIGHSGLIFDLKWNPFNDYQIASASDDCTIKLWTIPEGGLTSILSEFTNELLGHRRKITQLEWHPSTSNVLFSAGFDNLVIVWDVSTSPLNGNSILKIIDCHVDQIYSLAVNREGSHIATTSKDKILRIIEPRTGIVVAEGMAHNGTKQSRVVFLNDSRVLTTGFSKHSDRQFSIWNQHDLKTPLASTTIDSASGIVQPFFDYETKTLYLCGKGEGTIRYYEIVDEAPHIYYLNQFISGQPQKSLGWMPKRGLNVATCEIFRFYKIHAAGNVVEPISFNVPRKSTLFQSDLYPDTLSIKPAMTINEWFVLRQNTKPNLMSMNTLDTHDTISIMRKSQNQNTFNDNNKKITTIEQTTTKVSNKFVTNQQDVDMNLKKKFAFLANETIPDYRTAPQRITTLKEEKTTTNQSTKFHQLQSIFNSQTNGHSPKHNVSSFEENISYVHSENEVSI
jgi:coronin-2